MRNSQERLQFANRSHYEPYTGIVYASEEIDVAAKLFAVTPSSFTGLDAAVRDSDWRTETSSQVRRYALGDGNFGYFKSLWENSDLEDDFLRFGTSSLAAAINEVNAFRMSRALGERFEKLVPDTSFELIDGFVGTLQRGVRAVELSDDYDCSESEVFRLDYRNAAIFDFICGSMDRHHNNYLYEETNSGVGIRLIDNSASFPHKESFVRLNSATFANGESVRTSSSHKLYEIDEAGLSLDSDDRRVIALAGDVVRSWMVNGTIGEMAGQAALDRVDALLSKGIIIYFKSYCEVAYMRDEVRARILGTLI